MMRFQDIYAPAVPVPRAIYVSNSIPVYYYGPVDSDPPFNIVTTLLE